ncbi:thrombospondin type 1 domain protein [Ancylostoma caninum]|uniref:Thrombospondin type 1 domain protein n=1 Tax=Ancylostoma caninum TaxID=29170 RepID=A0A368GI86_ANCCA|nr:thrombospondin type 1 domain protein [Ancylostoma caninum]
MYRGMAHTGCEGSAQDQSSCPTHACPTWSEWGDWSECSATCGQGNQYRYFSFSTPLALHLKAQTILLAIIISYRMRSCESGADCAGSNRELRFCQLTSCPYWDEWMTWSGCSVTCGVGICERRRRCVMDDLLNLPNLEELDEALFDADASRAGRCDFYFPLFNHCTKISVKSHTRHPRKSTLGFS